MDQRRKQDQIAHVEHGRRALRPQAQKLGQKAPFEEIVKVGPIVSGRRDRELIALDVLFGVQANECRCRLEVIWPFENIVAIDLLNTDAGIIGEIERAARREILQFCNLGSCEGAVLDNERCRLPAADQRNPGARVGNSTVLQSLDRRGEQLQRIARRQLQPKRDREKPARRQVIEVLSDCLDCVSIVLVQALRASRSCAKRIEKRDLYEIVASGGSRYKAARLSDMHVHLGPVVDAAGKVGVFVGDEVDDLRIELYGIDLPGTVVKGQEHLLAAARPEDQDLGILQQMKGQRRSGEIQVAEALQVTLEPRDGADRLGVCKHSKLQRRLDCVVEGQPWSMAKGNGWAFDDADKAKRA